MSASGGPVQAICFVWCATTGLTPMEPHVEQSSNPVSAPLAGLCVHLHVTHASHFCSPPSRCYRPVPSENRACLAPAVDGQWHRALLHLPHSLPTPLMERSWAWTRVCKHAFFIETTPEIDGTEAAPIQPGASVARLQKFLDQHGISPGVINGFDGGNVARPSWHFSSCTTAISIRKCWRCLRPAHRSS